MMLLKKPLKKILKKYLKSMLLKVNTITKKSKSKIIRGKIGLKKVIKKHWLL